MREQRVDSTATLVDQLAGLGTRKNAHRELAASGRAALPALRAGLGHGRWEVRRECVVLLAGCGGPEQLAILEPLLLDEESDPKLHKYAGIGWIYSRERAADGRRGARPW